jgi:hypothetical protein
MYCIIKKIPNENGVVLPVIVIDDHDEVLEYETLDEAEKMALVFEKNSDSGYEYVVKQI